MTCKETQTEAGLNLKSDEFNFYGDNDRELGWHMERNHWWPGDQKAETESMNEFYITSCEGGVFYSQQNF